MEDTISAWILGGGGTIVSVEDWGAYLMSLRSERLSKYIEVAGFMLLVVDYCEMLPLEVEHIWKRRWKLVDCLYLGCRYFAFVDIPVAIYHRMNTAYSDGQCAVLGIIMAVLYLIGMTLAGSIMFVRLYALSARSPSMKKYLISQCTIIHFVMFVLVVLNLKQARYHPPAIRTVSVCVLLAKDKVRVMVLWGLILLNEALLALISVWIGYGEHTRTRNVIVQVLYRDGMAYIVCLSALSLSNMIVNLVGPVVFRFVFATLQRVLHTIFATRMILHVRELSDRQKGCLQEFTVKDGEVLELGTRSVERRLRDGHGREQESFETMSVESAGPSG